MKNVNKIHEPDPQPPELREGHYPTLKKVWGSWAIGIGSFFIIMLIVVIIFYETGF